MTKLLDFLDICKALVESSSSFAAHAEPDTQDAPAAEDPLLGAQRVITRMLA